MEVKDYIKAFEEGKYEITPGVTGSWREEIEQAHRMRAGVFEDPLFSDGETQKIYYNVVFGFAQILLKGSKNKINQFGLKNKNGDNQYLVDVMRGAMKNHLKHNWFSKINHEVTKQVIDFGMAQGKIVDGEVELVDLRNIVFRPDVPMSEGGGVEYERILYEEAEARYGDTENWKEIEDHYKNLPDDSKPFVNFVHFAKYDEFDGEMQKGIITYLDRSLSKSDKAPKTSDWNPHIEIDRVASTEFRKPKNKKEFKLYGEKVQLYPYVEAEFITMDGRPPVGVYALCNALQEHYNENANLERKSNRLTLNGIMKFGYSAQRRPEDVDPFDNEFVKRMDTGAFFKIRNDEEFSREDFSTPLNVERMQANIMQFCEFLLGITPIATGDKKGNETAYEISNQVRTQESTYGEIKRKVAHFWEVVFTDHLLEDIIEDITAEDMMTILGSPAELLALDLYLVEQQVRREQLKTKKYLTQDDMEAEIERRLEELSKKGDTRTIPLDKQSRKVVKELIKKLDTMVDFAITDEYEDDNAKMNIILQAQQIQNPKVRAKIYDIAGINPREVELTDREKKKLADEQAQMIQAQQVAQAGQAGQVTPPVEQPQQ